ncbi:Hypothetical predicted protein [Pelobates cultripes]|uniref:Uncharacterized protein n=1 Tax=Pelobates cultripes TaxID=61616 RepID=A0AAD1TH46_PELCU|nr:Hypothetical predicted protein [Pelobates cultripes]
MAATPKMAEMDPGSNMQPQSPQISECSLKSMDNNTDPDIKEILKNLPLKSDLQHMMSKLEAIFHSRMEAMGSDVRQLNLRVNDLEEERDVIQAHITNISSTMESYIQFMSATQRHIDDLTTADAETTCA